MNELHFASRTKQGTYHSVNQDSINTPTAISKKLLAKKGYLFIVCDGVGGYEGGEVASKFCCQELLKAYYEQEQAAKLTEWFKQKILQLNNQIIDYGIKHNLRRMSTTLTALLIKGNKSYSFNIGDSRIYLYHDSLLRQITDDDSVVWQQYEKNLIEKDDIVTSSIKNLITQALGFDKKISISTKEHSLPEKYCFLLCSDGLTDVSIDDEIELAFKNGISLNNILTKLHKIARENSSHDDVSTVLVSNYLGK